MKLILNLLKALSVLYWALAASLFISLLFIPQALDTAYDAYLGVSDQFQSSEVIDEESSSEDISSEETTESSEEEETTEDSEEGSEVAETQPLVLEPISEETEFVVLSKAEFKDALEQSLLYSAIVMIPFTVLVFSLSKKLKGEDLLPEEVKEEVKETAEKSKKKKAVKAVKLIEIGLTGLKVPK